MSGGAPPGGAGEGRSATAAPPTRRDELIRSTGLLDAELPDRRFVDERYLDWLYDRNPLGPAFAADLDDPDDGVRIGHYALVPQTYRDRRGEAPFVFSLNAVARSGRQRRGVFGQLGAQVWGRARDAGVRVVVGVTNDKSTWAVHKYGWRVAGPLPVRLVPPTARPPAGVVSQEVTPELLASPAFAELAGDLDRSPAWHWTNCWTSASLRWRLAAPNVAPYTLHVSDDLVGVTTVEHRGGVPVAVVLKLLPRGGRFGPLAGGGLVSAMCRHHRAPVALHAGFNRHVQLRGVPLPERLKPVPLNLCVLPLDGRIDAASFRLDTFELLDMDAY